jgi:hypothetical protein
MDPRLLTAFALFIVGLAATSLAVRIWWTHPINRVFSLGPFVTEAGLKALLVHSPTIFALGLFAYASSASHLAFVARWNGHIGTEAAHFFGLVEALFATWAAIAVTVTAWRLWRGR